MSSSFSSFQLLCQWLKAHATLDSCFSILVGTVGSEGIVVGSVAGSVIFGIDGGLGLAELGAGCCLVMVAILWALVELAMQYLVAVAMCLLVVLAPQAMGQLLAWGQQSCSK